MLNATGSRAIGYIRVSTAKQAESGLGASAQRDAIERWAKQQGVDLAAVHADEGVSGSTDALDRDGLVDAIGDLQRGDTLVVAKRDRLARDLFVMGGIERMVAKRGARIVSVAGEGTGTDADDPAGLLQRGIVDLFAQYERALARFRTRVALRGKARRGGRVGRFAATGYRLEVVTEADEQGRPVERGVQVVDEREQRVLAAVAEAMSCGCGMSLRCIAARLAEQGLVSRAGTPYSASAIRRMRDRIAQQSKVAA
jgi:DNA invertase Pin-like site-specific DNA recombinase